MHLAGLQQRRAHRKPPRQTIQEILHDGKPQTGPVSIHGHSFKDAHGSPHSPVYDTTTFPFKSTAGVLDVVESRTAGSLYTRYGLNPSIFAIEETLAGLEGAEMAWSFCSGMAAETALFLTHGREGIVCIGDAYGGTLELIADLEQALG
jgi:cystathionine gamma-synthase